MSLYFSGSCMLDDRSSDGAIGSLVSDTTPPPSVAPGRGRLNSSALNVNSIPAPEFPVDDERN